MPLYSLNYPTLPSAHTKIRANRELLRTYSEMLSHRYASIQPKERQEMRLIVGLSRAIRSLRKLSRRIDRSGELSKPM